MKKNYRNLIKKLDINKAHCLLGQYGVQQIDFSTDTFLSPMNYHESYAMGAIFSGCENIDISECNISEISAPGGAAAGLAINNECKNINIDDLNVWNLLSCSTCFDSATFVIDEASENITTTSMKLNPNSSSLT